MVDTSRLEIGSAAAAAAAALAVIAMITSAPGWLVYVRTVYTFPRVPYIGWFTARDARLRQRSVPVPVQRGGKILLNVEEITRRPPSSEPILISRSTAGPSSGMPRAHRESYRETRRDGGSIWRLMHGEYTAVDALTRDRAISRSSRVFTGQMRYPISREH